MEIMMPLIHQVLGPQAKFKSSRRRNHLDINTDLWAATDGVSCR